MVTSLGDHFSTDQNYGAWRTGHIGLLAATGSPTAEYERIFEPERKLGMRPEFAAVARYTHFLAHRGGPVLKDGA